MVAIVNQTKCPINALRSGDPGYSETDRYCRGPPPHWSAVSLSNAAWIQAAQCADTWNSVSPAPWCFPQTVGRPCRNTLLLRWRRRRRVAVHPGFSYSWFVPSQMLGTQHLDTGPPGPPQLLCWWLFGANVYSTTFSGASWTLTGGRWNIIRRSTHWIFTRFLLRHCISWHLAELDAATIFLMLDPVAETPSVVDDAAFLDSGWAFHSAYDNISCDCSH